MCWCVCELHECSFCNLTSARLVSNGCAAAAADAAAGGGGGGGMLLWQRLLAEKGVPQWDMPISLRCVKAFCGMHLAW